MDYLSNTWAKVRVVLVSMPPSQRYTMGALVALVVISLALLLTGGTREEYSPVLTELSSADITNVQAALKGTDVKYKVGPGMLSVPNADKDRVFMLLSEKGALPSDMSKSFSFEDLVKPSGFNLDSEVQQQLKFNVALGNMLSRAISTMPEVRSAQVQIASKRDGYFGPEKATAAVAITPRTTEPISKTKLAAICRLVAAAAGPHLLPSAVTVTVPATGQSFSLAEENSTFAMAATRMELQKGWDAYYAEEIENYLRPAFGMVQTLISVKVDTTTKSNKEIEYTTTKERSEESSVTTGGTSGGDTLTKPNTGASVVTGTAIAAAGPAEERTEKEKTSSPSKESLTETPPGEVTDVQISVLADQNRLEAMIRAKQHITDEKTEITAAMIKTETDYWARQLLALPITGDDTKRLAKVTFSVAPFARLGEIAAAEMPAVPTSTRLLDVLVQNWERIALVILSIMALLMIRSVAKRGAEPEVALVRAEQAAEEEVLLPEIEVNMDQKRSAKMRESIEDMIRRDPQSAVSLIKRWLARET